MPEHSQLSVVSVAALAPEQSAWQRALDAASASASGLGPFSASAPGSASASASGPASAGDAPSPLIGPEPTIARVATARLPSLRGVQLLDQLGLLSRSELRAFVAQHPHTMQTLVTSPAAASAVAARWSNWPAAVQRNLIAADPALVGNLEGVSYAARDAANRSYLNASEAGIRAQLDNPQVGRAAKDELNKRLHMLGQVRLALQTGTSGNRRSLISLDPTGEGRAVIVTGNPTNADYVDYLIPGMFSDVDTQITTLAGGSDTIATEQQAWLKKLNPGVAASQVPTVAVIAWIGYQTPSIVNVASLQLAHQGQQALTNSIEGLRAERAAQPGGTQPYLAILAHSYGSTAAMLALQNDDVRVDALAVVGSPGSPARTVGDLNVTDGNVWVGAGETDPVPQTGIFGSQPTSAAYGAHRFGVDGAVDPLTGASLSTVVGHDGYFNTGSESIRNMVLIGIGRGDLVLGLDGSSALSLSRAHATVPKGPRV